MTDPTTSKTASIQKTIQYGLQSIVLFILPFIAMLVVSQVVPRTDEQQLHQVQMCYDTCSIRIVETIPSNISFGNVELPMSTYDAWSQLILNAQEDIAIAAYKSSLQGKHVLDEVDASHSTEGDSIYNQIMEVGKGGNVQIKMIENYPPKDKGDNADGEILQGQGAVNRQSIDISKYIGRGKMHSKFLIADKKNFYLGSANLDWRSLNQKMELGVLVENCECLGNDLYNNFDVLWKLKNNGVAKNEALSRKAAFNKEHPLKVQIQGEDAQVYIATSPKDLNHRSRTWDLDAIVSEIDNSKEFCNIHVMDYFPLFIYKKPQTLFSKIDDAIRRAVVRGVRVRLLTAALHYPDIGTRFLRSLQSLNNIRENVTVEVRIFKVPTTETDSIVIQRERRTHNKFMVTESAVIIGTSNWSGDYFESGTTGLAFVIKQNYGGVIREMEEIFERDWESDYAHPLDDYFENCIKSQKADFCEGVKDPTLFSNPQMAEV